MSETVLLCRPNAASLTRTESDLHGSCRAAPKGSQEPVWGSLVDAGAVWLNWTHPQFSILRSNQTRLSALLSSAVLREAKRVLSEHHSVCSLVLAEEPLGQFSILKDRAVLLFNFDQEGARTNRVRNRYF